MRLAVCTLSAVLLSGCSWFGYGGSTGNFNSYNSGANCNNAGAYGGQYGQVNYSGGAYGSGGCANTNVYGANGYGVQGAQMAQGFQATQNFQATQGFQNTQGAIGLRGAQGMQGYGYNGQTNGYTAGGGSQFVNGKWVFGTTGSGTVLNGAAPYGTAVGGYGSNTQGSVTTVQGAPIYVPQPYPAYYGGGVAAGGCGGNISYGCGGLRGGFTALPFGIEAGIGTDIAIGGDIVGDKPGGLALGGVAGKTLNTSGSSAISYGDAYKNAVSYDLGVTYDVDPSTTLLARLGYSKAKGQRVRTGTVDDSAFVPAPAIVTSENLYAQWSDLEQFTVEGGVRKYMGGWNNTMSGIRPYVQATAGFAHNNAVSLSQSSATLMPEGSNVQPYIDAGWVPTASGAIGAEMQVGPRTAIGVEAGLRWSDDFNAIAQTDDRWSVPIKLRGRVSF